MSAVEQLDAAVDLVAVLAVERQQMIANALHSRRGRQAILPQPTPELPPFDFLPSLTAGLEEMVQTHEQYAQAIQAALERAGPVPEIGANVSADASEKTEP